MSIHPDPKIRWKNMRIISYISLFSVISMMGVAGFQGWLDDSYGAFLFSFTTLISGYFGLSSSVDYLVKKNDTVGNSEKP